MHGPRRATLIVAALAAIIAYPLYAVIQGTVMAEPTIRADRLFREQAPGYDPEIHAVAREIERGERPSAATLEALGPRIDSRHGDGITLLFHAVASANLEAVDALLAAGADTDLPDRPTGSSRTFVYLLTLPGGPLIGEDGVNRMIASYLRHGGDPNATFGDPARSQGNLPFGVALGGNVEGLMTVLEAGGDPWAPTYRNGARDTNAVEALTNSYEFAALDALIDRGHFDDRAQAELQSFLGMLGTYAQRRDEISREIQRVAKRVLKRNPDYVETATGDDATRRIFKDHWQDPEPGTIPWDEIMSDAVD
jgi:hypothetical protein